MNTTKEVYEELFKKMVRDQASSREHHEKRIEEAKDLAPLIDFLSQAGVELDDHQMKDIITGYSGGVLSRKDLEKLFEKYGSL